MVARRGWAPALGRFLQASSRRRVTQVTFAYAAIAWVIAQVGELLLLKVLHLPDWTLSLLVGLLLLGFPLTAVLAWCFNLTPGGIQADRGDPVATTPAAGAAADDSGAVAAGTTPERRAGDRRAMDAADAKSDRMRIAVVLGCVAILGLGAFVLFDRLAPATPPLPSEASIAVLPFTSLSPDRQDSYFAEGLAVELHDALAGVQGLKLAARSSATAKGVHDLDARQLGARLGVAYVLDASVRRDGARVRVNARLSDTRTGFTTWSKPYDRQMSDVFALQGDLANEVVQALLGVLPGARPALARRLSPTRSVIAYELYLKGLQQLQGSADAARLDRAIGFFGQALAADAGFARAQAGICRAHIKRFISSHDAAAFERAQAACMRASSMDPQLREVSLALGDMYQASGEPDKATEHYRKALADPSLRAEGYLGMARIHGARNQHVQALELLGRAQALRPGDADIYSEVGFHHYLNGDLAQAIEAFRAATALQPDNSSKWSSLGGLYLASGDSVQAAAAFHRSLAIKPNYAALSNLGTIRYSAGAYAEAADLYRRAAKLDESDYRLWGNLGDALSARPGAAAPAREAYLRAARMGERYVGVKSDDAHALATLAWYRANLGESDTARGLLQRAEALGTETAEVALLGAQTLALLGDPAGARSRIAAARKAGISEQRIRTSPVLRGVAGAGRPSRQTN